MRSRGTRVLVGSMIAFGALLSSREARAEGVGVAAAGDVIAGIEGGAKGYAAGVRRTRTMLRFGLDSWLEDWPSHSLAIGTLVEVEPKASFGADLRYQLRLADDFVFHVGGTAIIAPDYMIGTTFGAAYRLDVIDIVELSFGPMGNVYFFGNDLPSDHRVLWQAVAAVGIRVEL